MIAELKVLLKSKDLLYMLTWRDIRVRYKQSVMGLLWAILMPSLIVGAGSLVRVAAGRFSGVPVTADDIASVMVRAVIWSFYVSSIRFSTNCLLGNSSLVTKIAFPKEVFPIAAVMSSLFDFLVATAAVVVVLIFLGWTPGPEIFLTIPLGIVLVMQVIGLSLFLSAANLFFRDVKYLVEVFLTYAIFFTPVLYEASIAGKWKPLVMLNPVSALLEGFSAAVVGQGSVEPIWLYYSVAFSVLILVISYSIFKQLESKFAESI